MTISSTLTSTSSGAAISCAAIYQTAQCCITPTRSCRLDNFEGPRQCRQKTSDDDTPQMIYVRIVTLSCYIFDQHTLLQGTDFV